MGKRVILVAMLLFATLGVVRGQEYIDDGWYYLLYDDFGERTAVLEASTRPVEDRDLQIPEYIDAYGDSYRVVEIGDDVFAWNTSIRTVTLPPSLQTIGKRAFQGCDSLVSINLENVKKIGVDAFNSCDLLKSVDLSSLFFIDEHTFSSCYALESVKISEKTTSIGYDAFWYCERLFSVIIPDGVESIGDNAFENCGLRKLTLGKNVKTIGDNAFASCSELLEIHSLAVEPPAYLRGSPDGVLFSGISNTYGILYVPEGSVDAYRQADEWGNFVSIRDSVYPDYVEIPITSITLDPDTLIIIRDMPNKYYAYWSITPENASYPQLSYEVENQGKFDVFFYNGSGRISVSGWGYAFDTECPMRSDTAVIRLSTTDGSNLSATCTVIYIAQQATYFSLGQDSVTIECGGSFADTCELLPQYASYVRNIEWTSSDESVAWVTMTHWSNRRYGFFGEGPGTAIITARTTDGSNLCDTCVVTVLPSTTGVAAVESAAVQVYASGGRIVVDGSAPGEPIVVCRLDGVVVQESVSTGKHMEIPLPFGGMYIVNVNGTVRKVVL